MTPTEAPQNPSPRIGAAQVRLLERLSNACAVSGDEGEVRKIVLEKVRPHADRVEVDPLGNVLAVRAGKGRNRLRVMLAAHMDEVGFMLTADDGEGVYRFDTVGGLDARFLAGKPVWVGKDHAAGVIGAKPIHLTSRKERRNTIEVDSLRIDMGPSGGAGVQVGDRATFATHFSRLGPSLLGKALDDRLGVASLILLLQNSPENIDLLAAFTVQEEVGLRGARVAAYALEPDLAFALDSTPAYDFPGQPGEENTRYNTRLGAGPAIYLADRATLSDPRLVRLLAETAELRGIPYQFRQPGGGGTDAGAIHRQRAGIPSISVSVPGRYAHTPAGLARRSDWRHTVALVHAALGRISQKTLAR
jgi:endoglucanase